MVRLSQLLDTMLIYVCPQPVLSSRLLHMLLYYKNNPEICRQSQKNPISNQKVEASCSLISNYITML